MLPYTIRLHALMADLSSASQTAMSSKTCNRSQETKNTTTSWCVDTTPIKQKYLDHRYDLLFNRLRACTHEKSSNSSYVTVVDEMVRQCDAGLLSHTAAPQVPLTLSVSQPHAGTEQQLPQLTHSTPRPCSPDTTTSASTTKHWVCPVCPMVLSGAGHLRRHIECHGRTSFKRQCEKCNYGTNSFAGMVKHKRVHEPDYQRQPQQKCAECAYVTTSAHRMKTHQQHHNQKFRQQFQCSSCSYSCAQYGVMRIHKRKHHDNKRTLSCNPRQSLRTKPPTKQSTSRKTRVVQEKESWSIELLYDRLLASPPTLDYPNSMSTKITTNLASVRKCPHCDFKVDKKNRSRLPHHLKYHDREVPGHYRCPLCNYSTDSKSYLGMHRRNHHQTKTNDESKKLKCPYCDHTSVHRSSLNRHLLCHSRPVPEKFGCPLCCYSVGSVEGLRQHKLFHHLTKNAGATNDSVHPSNAKHSKPKSRVLTSTINQQKSGANVPKPKLCALQLAAIKQNITQQQNDAVHVSQHAQCSSDSSASSIEPATTNCGAQIA